MRRSLDDVRRIARELRPEVLDDLGLQSALRSLCTAAAAHDGLRVERELELERRRVSPEVELVVYRVAQESLTNVMRHAGASEVLVALHHVDGGLRLVVRDDGRGLPADGGPTGAGIAGMQERALHIGARLTLSSLRPAGPRSASTSRSPRGRRDAPLTTRILLADDHPIVLRGLRMVLDAQPDLTVVGRGRRRRRGGGDGARARRRPRHPRRRDAPA